VTDKRRRAAEGGGDNPALCRAAGEAADRNADTARVSGGESGYREGGLV